MNREASKSCRIEEVKVLVLSHCILNLATRWWQDGRSMKTRQGPVGQVLRFLSNEKIGAVQLPCPEFGFFGNPRPPATKDEYEDKPNFRMHCENLAIDSAQYLRTLVTKARNPRIRILAIVGVERSPSCGVECTPRTVNGKTEYLKENGLFVELLEREMENLGFRITVMGLDIHTPGDLCRRLGDLLNKTSKDNENAVLSK